MLYFIVEAMKVRKLMSLFKIGWLHMKNLKINKLINRYKKLSFLNKIGFWGTIASFLSLIIALVPDNSINIDKKYIDGEFYFSQNNLEKAEEILKQAFNYNPSYNNLAYLYGRTLFRRKKFEEALSIWNNIPISEEHINLSFWVAQSYIAIGKTNKAKENLELFIKKSEGRSEKYYWIARAQILIIEYKNNSLRSFEEKVNKFLLEIDSYQSIRLATRTVLVNTPKRFLDHILDLDKSSIICIIQQKNIAFHLLQRIAKSYFKKKDIDNGYTYLIKSLNYTKTPFLINYFPVTDEMIVGSLIVVNSILRAYGENKRKINYKKVEDILLEINNKEIKDCIACDISRIILLLNGATLKDKTIYSSGFIFKYECFFTDNVGLDTLEIESSKYFLGNLIVNLFSKKKYEFIKNIKIGRNTQFENPHFKITITDTSGNKTSGYLYPEIVPPSI